MFINILMRVYQILNYIFLNVINIHVNVHFLKTHKRLALPETKKIRCVIYKYIVTFLRFKNNLLIFTAYFGVFEYINDK